MKQESGGEHAGVRGGHDSAGNDRGGECDDCLQTYRARNLEAKTCNNDLKVLRSPWPILAGGQPS